MKYLTALLVALCSVVGAAASSEVWVSPAGRDGNPGTKEAPVATLGRAAELVRTRRPAGGPVTVWLERGDYPVLQTWQFGPGDSGAPAAPVVWRAVEKGTVRLVGAKAVPPGSLRPVGDPALVERMAPAARGQVVALDLAGIKHAGPFPAYAKDTVDLCVLFQRGRRLPLSRWPNGEYGYTTMESVVRSGDFRAGRPDGGVFHYRGEQPARWQSAVADGGVWLRGFWRVPWVAETLQVKAIDPAARTISLAISTANGIGSKYSTLVDGTRVGDGKEAWYALNLLEEIDQPGEWSADFKRRQIFLWPREPVGEGELMIADNREPMITVDGASHLIFRDLILCEQMGDGVRVRGGEGVQFLGCEFTQIGRVGLLVRDGVRHRVQSCDFSEIGLSAIDVTGGDRRTLAPSGHEIVNNHIFRVALSAPVPALVAGLDARHQNVVGVRIASNRIHDASYGGITFGGNENILERNEIYRVGLDGGDLGAFYNTGGWTTRGNVLRRNFVHHCENANAFYMDDGAGGSTIEENVVFRAESGLFIGGGHDNVAARNLLVACARAIHVDDRGVARKYVPTDGRLRGDLDSVPYRGELWSRRYPQLAGILDSNPSVPHGNRLERNVAVGCGTLARLSGARENFGGVGMTGNLEWQEPGVASGLEDFTLTPSADLQARWPVRRVVEEAGLVVDEYRPRLPERDLELLRHGNTKRKAFDSQRDVEAYK